MLENVIKAAVDEINDLAMNAFNAADRPELLGSNIPYTNLVLARSNLLLALSNFEKVSR